MTLRAVERGNGAPLLLVHGSAAESSTWNIQLAMLGKRAHVIAVERRPGCFRVEAHASDLVELLEQRQLGPVTAVGSSFGAVICLELAIRRPDLLSRAVLCEPPLSCGEYVPAVPVGFGCRFDSIVARLGGPAAGEYFLRLVLGDESFESMPAAFRERACALWERIREDSLALARYRIRQVALSAIRVPVVFVGGARSAIRFRETMDSLSAHIPGSSIEILAGAGHMMHVDAARQFNELVLPA